MTDRAHMDANEVIEGWHPEDARQVLEAVKMAADGMITKNEMFAKIMNAAGITKIMNAAGITEFEETVA